MAEAKVQEHAPTENTGQEVAEAAPGAGVTSFEELEAVDNYQSESRAKQIEADAEAAQAALEAAKETIKKDENVEETAKKVEKEKDVKPEEKVAEAKEEGEVDEESGEIKVFKVKSGDSEVEITSESEHTVKVDGEEKVVTYDELVNGYAGQKAIRQRFSQLAREKEEFVQERSSFQQDRLFFDQKIGGALKLLQSNPMVGLLELAEMAHLDKGKFQKEFTDLLIEQVDMLANMSEAERNAYNQKLMLDHEDKRLKAERFEIDANKARDRFLQESNLVIQEFNIAPELYQEIYHAAQKMQSNGQLQSAPTARQLASVCVDERALKQVERVAEAVNPSLSQDTQFITELKDLLKSQDPKGQFSDADVKDMIVASYGDDYVDEDERKLSDKAAKSDVRPTAKPEVKPVAPQNELVSFDDLNF